MCEGGRGTGLIPKGVALQILSVLGIVVALIAWRMSD